METPNPRSRRSLLGLMRSGAHRSAPLADEQPPSPPRVWANAAEMLADQFALPSA